MPARWPLRQVFFFLALLGVAALVAWRAPSADRGAPAGAVPATSPGARDLARDEAAGGHTLARHVGQSDRELADRLADEPGVAAASSFTDRATAERVVTETLRREHRRLRAWLEPAGGANLALDFRGVPGEVVGRTLLRGARAARPTGDARIVLRRAGDGFFVLTAYPVEDR